MTRLASWLLLLLLFGGFAATAGALLWARAAAGKGMPAFSVYSEERNGLAPAARLVRKLGWEPVAVTRPIQYTRHTGLLILVEPPADRVWEGAARDFTEADARGLLGWVERGNTLFLCSNRPNAIFQELGVTVTGAGQADEDESPTVVRAAEAGGYTAGVDRLTVSAGPGLEAGGGLPLWPADKAAGAVLLRRGKGRVIAVADPSFLTAPRLLDRSTDNAVFLYDVAYRAARDGRVYFDGYHHGLRSAGGFWGYLHFHRQHWLVVEIGLVVLVGLWSVGVRLGPAAPSPAESHNDAVDYASALARIYEQAGVRRRLGQVLARDFLTALTRRLGLRRGALPAEILAAWRRQHPAPAEGGPDRLAELLRVTAKLRNGEVPPSRLLHWTRELDEFQETATRRS